MNNSLKSFDAETVYAVLNRIKLGAGTLVRDTENSSETDCLHRLHTCRMLALYEGGAAKIATLTESGLVLHTFFSCWASMQQPSEADTERPD